MPTVIIIVCILIIVYVIYFLLNRNNDKFGIDASHDPSVGVEPEPSFNEPSTTKLVMPNDHLYNIFSDHGIPCKIIGDVIRFDEKPDYAAFARIIQNDPNKPSVQLDIHFKINDCCTIVESFAGMGSNIKETIPDAFENFCRTTLHVILGAFFNENDDQIMIDERIIDQKIFKIVVGNFGVRGAPPKELYDSESWYTQLEKIIERQPMPSGINWYRIYYAHMNGKSMIFEALLNNHIWTTVFNDMQSIDWPESEEFYSVRQFVVLIQGKKLD